MSLLATFLQLCHNDASYSAGFLSVLSLDKIFSSMGLSFGSAEADAIMINIDILDDGRVDISKLESMMGSEPSHSHHHAHHAHHHAPAHSSMPSQQQARYYDDEYETQSSAGDYHAYSATASSQSSPASTVSMSASQLDSKALHHDFSKFDQGLCSAAHLKSRLSSLGVVVSHELNRAIDRHERGNHMNFRDFVRLVQACGATAVSMTQTDQTAKQLLTQQSPPRAQAPPTFVPVTAPYGSSAPTPTSTSSMQPPAQDALRAFCRGDIRSSDLISNLRANGVALNRDFLAAVERADRDGNGQFRVLYKLLGGSAMESAPRAASTVSSATEDMRVTQDAKPHYKKGYGDILSWGKTPEASADSRRARPVASAPYALSSPPKDSTPAVESFSSRQSAQLMSPTQRSSPNDYGWSETASSAPPSAASTGRRPSSGNILTWNDSPSQQEKVQSKRILGPRGSAKPVWAYD